MYFESLLAASDLPKFGGKPCSFDDLVKLAKSRGFSVFTEEGLPSLGRIDFDAGLISYRSNLSPFWRDFAISQELGYAYLNWPSIR